MVRFIAIAALLVFGASLVSPAAVTNRNRSVAPIRTNGIAPAATVTQPSLQPVQPVQPTQPALQPSTSQPSMMGMGPSMMGMGPSMMPNSAVAVDSQSVYIVNGNQLWKVNKFTGQIMSSTMIPSIQVQPAGPGAGPGQFQPGYSGMGVQPNSLGVQPGPTSIQPSGANIMQPPVVAPSGSMAVPSQPSAIGSGPGVIGQPGTPTQPSLQPSLQPGIQPRVPGVQPTTPGIQPVSPAAPTQPGAAGAGPLYTQPGAVPQWQPTPEAAPAQIPGVTTGEAGSVGAAAGAGPEMNLPTSVAVDESSVYVVRGNQFLRFNKDNLQFMGYSSLQSVPGQGGAGPTVCQPGTVVIQSAAACGVCPPGAISVMPAPACPPYGAGPAAVCPPGPVFVSSTTCPPSTIPVGVGQSCFDQLCNAKRLSSCRLDQSYIQMLLQLNTAAIAYSQLAQTKATQPTLKDFATREISLKCAENSQLTKDLYDWYGMSVTTTLTPTDTQTYNKLNQYSGSNFDVLYMQAILQNNNEVMTASRLVRDRVAEPGLGRTAVRLGSAEARQSAQLQTWLRDWYNVCVTEVPCPICQ